MTEDKVWKVGNVVMKIMALVVYSVTWTEAYLCTKWHLAPFCLPFGGDCLEGKRENYQVCFLQYCVQQLYTVNCTHIWTLNRHKSSLDWVLSHWAHFNLRRFILVYVIILFLTTLHPCVLCSIVTRWAGPGGIEAWSLGPLLPSVLWHCWLGDLTHKTRPPIWPIMCSVGR